MRWIVVAVSIVLAIEAKVIEAKVPTAKVQVSDRVYAGKFLAIGYLPANKRYVIDAPIEGMVEHLGVQLFGETKRGEPLLIIKSPKILEIEAEYIDALIERDYYLSEIKRLKPLYEAAVVAKKVYLKAKNDLAKFQTKVDFLKNLLKDWGLGPAQIKKITRTKRPDPFVRLYAPIDGRIADLAIHPRIYLHRGDHILTTVDTSKVYAKVALPLQIASILKEGQTLYIDSKQAQIQSISPTVDSVTQTVAVLIEVPIALLPNQKRNVVLELPRRSFVVPASAVVDIDGRSGVFVQRSNGFEFVPVQVLSRSEELVYILSDAIGPQDRVAVSGVISLKGAWEAENDR